MYLIAMWEVMSDGFNRNVIRHRLSVKNSREAISIIALVDLLVIVPSIILFLAFNLKLISSFGIPFLILVLSFLFYLPLAMLFASFYFSNKEVESSAQVAKNKILPTILFLMLIFAMLGVYIPSIEKLTLLIPSFGSLNIAGFAIVTTNVTFIVKNFTKFMSE